MYEYGTSPGREKKLEVVVYLCVYVFVYYT